MGVSYKKLFELMDKNNMSKTDLRLATGIGQNTLAKLGKDEYVSMEVICKICEYFKCDICDIVSVINSDKI
ncbi:MAG: helix-turn-helix transcriptional regulator [Holdemanella sp.]|nr:helix-turn-helix transcriptional regulator [Holdemanella sp.]